MDEGRIVDTLFVKKKGKEIEIVFRYPKCSDLNQILVFDNKVRKETKFLDIINKISWRDEEKWLRDILSSIGKNNCVCLLAEQEGSIIGVCTVKRQKEATYRHVGVYDIVVKKEYWGLGVGSKLTQQVIALAKNKLKLKILRLILYSGNKQAEKLYEKFKFRVAGRIPKGVIHSGTCMDEIIFYKNL